jgi:hypothetical protein
MAPMQLSTCGGDGVIRDSEAIIRTRWCGGNPQSGLDRLSAALYSADIPHNRGRIRGSDEVVGCRRTV